MYCDWCGDYYHETSMQSGGARAPVCKGCWPTIKKKLEDDEDNSNEGD